MLSLSRQDEPKYEKLCERWNSSTEMWQMKAEGIADEHPEGVRVEDLKGNLSPSVVKKIGRKLLEKKLKKTVDKSKRKLRGVKRVHC